MRVFVRELGGALVVAHFSATDSVAQAKERFSNAHVPASSLRLSLHSRELDDDDLALGACGVRDGATLCVGVRVRGGGCDGGTKAVDRKILTKLREKKEEVAPSEAARVKWSSCALSGKPFKQPVVVCELGRMYNKDELVLRLANKNLPEFPHIRGLKDVFEVKLTPSPQAEVEAAAGGGGDRARFMCPVTLTEMSGFHRFYAARACGCVFSQKALAATLPRKDATPTACVVCATPLVEPLLVLNPTDEEQRAMRQRMQDKREAKRLKKEKKSKKALAGEGDGDGEGQGEGNEKEEKGEKDAVVAPDARPKDSLKRKHEEAKEGSKRERTAKKPHTAPSGPSINNPAVSALAQQARQKHSSQASAQPELYNRLFAKSDEQSNNDKFICPPRLRGSMGWLF